MYRRKQVEEITGIPARRIQFYTDQGVLPSVEKATGRGREREYSRDDVFRLAVVNEFFYMGIQLSTIKVFLENDEKISQRFGEEKTISYDRFKNGCEDCFIFERIRDDVQGFSYNYITSPTEAYPLKDGRNISGQLVFSQMIINLPAIFQAIVWI